MGIKYKQLSAFYKELWWGLSNNLNLDLETYNYFEKKKKEKEFNILIDNIIKFIESFPENEEKRVQWRKKGNKYLENIISSENIFKLGVINKTMKESFIKATKDFIKESKIFDENIKYDDIGQAMRNVWIVNMLQQAFGCNVELNKAIFGYSMLYPYTDNYLDNIDINKAEKIKFNNKFIKRLNGEFIDNINEHEEKVYKLVEYIEDEFDRVEYCDVYESLKLIQRGQIESLDQQDNSSIPYEKDILGISIEKGGASVLVDGNLIRGYMNEEEQKFCYGYGFLLQLCDDLQDIKIDKENNHSTIMSQLAGNYKLDYIVNKLINLTLMLISEAQCFVGEDSEELKLLIKKNCIYMILFAVIDNKSCFSKEYINSIEKYLPFRIGYCVNIKDMITSKFSSIKSEYNKVKIDEILMYFLE